MAVTARDPARRAKAQDPARKGQAAKELAAELGISDRQVRKYRAVPRDEYEGAAAERKRQVLELRARDVPFKVIAAELGMTLHAAYQVAYLARKEAQQAKAS